MKTLEPGLELHRRVRAAFVLQGTTLRAWCREQGISAGNARIALIGSWNGPRGKEMRARICKAAGVLAHAPKGKVAA